MKPDYHKTMRKGMSSDSSPHYEAGGESFFKWLSLGMKHGSITLNCRQEDSHWNGIIQFLRRRRRSLRLPLQQGKSWPLFLGMQRDWFWESLCHVVKPLAQICTFRLLKTLQKLSRRVWFQEMLLKSSFSMTAHDCTQVWKHRKQSQSSDRLFLSTHHTAQISLPQISTSLEPSKMPSMGESLGAMIVGSWSIEQVATCTTLKLV